MAEEPARQFAPDPGVVPCPNCGAAVPVVDHWCDQCDWNVDPEPAEKPKRRQRRAQRHADRRGQHLYEDLVRARERGRRRHNLARLASASMAVLVMLTTPLFALVTALVWWRFGLSPASIIATVLLVPVAIEMRPRVGRAPWDVVVLDRTQAPELYRFVEELAPMVGTRHSHVVGLSFQFNASTMPIGWRGRRLVTLGVALWDQLEPQERTAAVCHELGHGLGSDTMHGVLVNNSTGTLLSWYRVLATNPTRLRNRSVIPELVMGTLGAGVKQLFKLQVHLARRGSPLAEYLADEAAARVASSEAMADALEALLVGRVAAQTLGFYASRRNRDVLGATRRSLAEMTPRQRERLNRAAKLRRHAVDETHPPTLLRVEMVRKLAIETPLFVLDKERSAALDREVDAVRGRLNELILHPPRRGRRRVG